MDPACLGRKYVLRERVNPGCLLKLGSKNSDWLSGKIYLGDWEQRESTQLSSLNHTQNQELQTKHCPKDMHDPLPMPSST